MGGLCLPTRSETQCLLHRPPPRHAKHKNPCTCGIKHPSVHSLPSTIYPLVHSSTHPFIFAVICQSVIFLQSAHPSSLHPSFHPTPHPARHFLSFHSQKTELGRRLSQERKLPLNLKFSAQDPTPHHGKRELISGSCPLTSTCMLRQDPMHMCAHMCTHANKCSLKYVHPVGARNTRKNNLLSVFREFLVNKERKQAIPQLLC